MNKTSLICLLLIVLPYCTVAAEPTSHSFQSKPHIALIIDDIGDNLHLGLRAIRLPGNVTCAFLPHTTYAHRLAISAHKHHKEVMLHLPMESEEGKALGPGALTLDMTRSEFLHTVESDLKAVPYAAGVNNHMGSLMTQHPGDMRWVMQALSRHGHLYFVDSRTTEFTVAQQVAEETGLPNLHRDVFLDNDQRPAAIATQFARLITLAKRRGSAVAIGHPHAATLRFLEGHLPQLSDEGITLVSVSELIRLKQHSETIYAARPSVLMGALRPDITSDPSHPSDIVTP